MSAVGISDFPKANPPKQKPESSPTSSKLSWATYSGFVKAMMVSRCLKPTEIVTCTLVCHDWKQLIISKEVERALYTAMAPPLPRNGAPLYADLSGFSAYGLDLYAMNKLHYVVQRAQDRADLVAVSQAQDNDAIVLAMQAIALVGTLFAIAVRKS